MTPEEYEWHLNFIKERYQYLNLTSEQAGEIYHYEKDNDLYSPKHYLTVWEEWDYETFTFRKILTELQFKTHQEKLAESMKRYEQSLIENDNQKTNYIAYNQEIFDYYLNVFLVGLFEESLNFAMPSMHSLKEKIAFLKSEYKLFLNDSKKAILAQHFRANRSYTPNEIEAALLAHRISYLWPVYTSFKRAADEGTKAVISYVSTNVKHLLPPQTEELLTKKIGELRAFTKAQSQKYYGELQGLFFQGLQPSSEEEKEERIMQFFLLDADYYGLKLK